MSEEDRKLQKHLVDEMMKVSETNPDVMFYMEALMKKYEELEQKVEQLENIRKEAIEELSYMSTDDYVEDYDIREKHYNLLMNILNKGE